MKEFACSKILEIALLCCQSKEGFKDRRGKLNSDCGLVLTCRSPTPPNVYSVAHKTGSSTEEINTLLSNFSPAIRFGRMPRSEKAKLKAEILTGEHDVENTEIADLKSLAKRIYEAYLKNFNMNKVKARLILAGKTSNNPVSIVVFFFLKQHICIDTRKILIFPLGFVVSPGKLSSLNTYF